MLLEQIQSPADVKKLSRAKLQTLVDECRQALLQNWKRMVATTVPT